MFAGIILKFSKVSISPLSVVITCDIKSNSDRIETSGWPENGQKKKKKISVK